MNKAQDLTQHGVAGAGRRDGHGNAGGTPGLPGRRLVGRAALNMFYVLMVKVAVAECTRSPASESARAMPTRCSRPPVGDPAGCHARSGASYPANRAPSAAQ